jgi:hypothetical protein
MYLKMRNNVACPHLAPIGQTPILVEFVAQRVSSVNFDKFELVTYLKHGSLYENKLSLKR